MTKKSLPIFLMSLACLAPSVSNARQPTPQEWQNISACIVRASDAYKVPVPLIMGIIKTESSFNLNARNTNRNGTMDVGLMQINSTWVPTLAKHGITYEQVKSDPCVNVTVGTWILASAIKQHGRNFYAVSSYNAGNKKGIDHIRVSYASKVKRAYEAYQYYYAKNGEKMRMLALNKPAASSAQNAVASN